LLIYKVDDTLHLIAIEFEVDAVIFSDVGVEILLDLTLTSIEQLDTVLPCGLTIYTIIEVVPLDLALIVTVTPVLELAEPETVATDLLLLLA
jgi:hypothetical protein